MTQAAVNSAKVLYRLSVSREDVEKAEKAFLYDTATAESSDEPGRTGSKKCMKVIDQVIWHWKRQKMCWSGT